MKFFLICAALLVAAIEVNSLGRPVEIYDVPSIAQIEIGLPVIGVWTQQCAATIVTSWYLLSISSCFEGTLENRRARVGTAIRSSGGILVEFASAVNHPDESADLSVLRVRNNLPLGPTIQSIPILVQDFVLPTGLPVELAGWGTTAEGGDISSSQLYVLDLVVTDQNACAAKYSEDPNISVTDDNMCLGLSVDSGRDYDARDMGDPVHYQNILVGLLSYGNSDGDDEYPIVTTLISSYTDWILGVAN